MNKLSFEKIFYHKKHLNEVLTKGESYPIHLELGLNNFCNHDCEFCYASDTKFKEGKNQKMEIDKNYLFSVIDEMKSLGLKSITIVGSGESTLHKDFAEIINGINNKGIELGLFTNGSTIKGKIAQAVYYNMTFIRFSITGASKRVHQISHGTTDFYEIINNINNLVKLRGENKFPTIGIQFILNHHSAGELFKAIDIAKDIGVDYFQIKPMIGLKEARMRESKLSFESSMELLRKAKSMETEDLDIYIKEEQTNTIYINDPTARIYRKCLGSITTTTLDGDSNFYICDNLRDKKFCFGNIENNSFSEIWNGERRKKILETLDVSKCPVACRMDPLNKIYEKIDRSEIEIPKKLSEVNPDNHINFL